MTSVYTPTKIFSMLPEKLSTNLTLLNENQARACVVVKIQHKTAQIANLATLITLSIKYHGKIN
jgi:exoribonuclease-2